MVLEAFAALGLAGNIVQFVDFSCKLVSEARAIHDSVKGVSEQHLELDVVSRELTALIDKVDASSPPQTTATGLNSVAERCREVAKSLSGELDELRPKKPTNTVWRSFVQAMKEARKGDRLKELAQRICVLQGSLNNQLLKLMADEIRTQMETLVAENKRLDLNRSGTMERLGDDIRDALNGLREHSRLQDSSIRDILTRIQSLDPVDEVEFRKMTDTMENLATKLLSLSREGTTVSCEQTLLRSLLFRRLRERQENVATAHTSTLKWIFEDKPPTSYIGPHPLFAKWLREGNGIYWVQGKPGSGKSTLMKFLCDQEITRSTLQSWSDPKRLITAAYFFWCSGSQLQRSQKGLLQGLLYEVLRQCPELISKVYPDPSATHYQHPEEQWTLPELTAVFSELNKQEFVSARFCFFIDGLDEYDGESATGTYEELISMIKGLAESPDIKICLSSRPWNVFQEAFHQCPSLALEDLNRDDISAYVQHTLVQDPKFERRLQGHRAYQDLVKEIVDKSQGVFLWVFLVVRSLKRGLTDDNNIYLLRDRVRRLPKDLKEYFQQILKSIDNVYEEHTAKTFKIVLASQEPLPLMAFSYLDEHEPLEIIPETSSDGPSQREQILCIHESMRKWLDGCSRGLLEVTKVPSTWVRHATVYQLFVQPRVEFLHRTVREFLQSKEMEHIFGPLEPGFDVDLALVRLLCQLLKSIPLANESHYSSVYAYFRELVEHACNIEKKYGTRPLEMLREVESYWPPAPDYPQSFLDLASHGGLALYLEKRLKEDDAKAASEICTVLWDGLFPESRLLRDTGSTGQASVDVALVLLSFGVNQTGNKGGTREFFQVIKLLFAHGASHTDQTMRLVEQCQCFTAAQKQELSATVTESYLLHDIPTPASRQLVETSPSSARPRLNILGSDDRASGRNQSSGQGNSNGETTPCEHSRSVSEAVTPLGSTTRVDEMALGCGDGTSKHATGGETSTSPAEPDLSNAKDQAVSKKDTHRTRLRDRIRTKVSKTFRIRGCGSSS